MSFTAQQTFVSFGAVAIAYTCGSIPFGLLLGRMKGIDIRGHGSGNIGATNVGRVLGRPWGILAFLLDMGKGLLPTLLFGLFVGRRTDLGFGGAAFHLVWAAVAAACIFGHLFPVFLGFKGGKGVATSLGALLGIYPYFTVVGLIAFALWTVLTLTTKYVSVGSVGASAAFPIIFAVAARLKRDDWGAGGDLWPLHVLAVAMAALVIWRHRANLQRLYRGAEHRIGSSTGAAR